MRALAKHFGNRVIHVALLVGAIAALFALTAAPASALKREYQTSFGAFPASNPQAVTVDQLTGDVYAVDQSAGTVSRFDSNGAPKNFTAGPATGTNTLTGFTFKNGNNQVAVDRSGGASDGNIYVTTSGEIAVFASSGSPLTTLTGSGTDNGDFGDACGVAVDQSNGDLYVGDQSSLMIWRYSPSGATVAEGDYEGGVFPFVGLCQVAAHNGAVYFIDEGGVLYRHSASTFTSPPAFEEGATFSAGVKAVAVDPTNGDVYVDRGDKVDVLAPDKSLLYSFGTGSFGTNSVGVAVKEAGNAYVADRTNGEIDVFGPFSPPDIPPVLTIKAATNVKFVKATVNGTLDPNGGPEIIDCRFEWGTTETYGNVAPCAQGANFSAPAKVSADLAGLDPGTIYHYRLSVTTGAGKFTSSDQSFTTLAVSSIPVVITGPGTAVVSATSTTLGGLVNPSANPLTDCHFEYVDDVAFQATGFADLSSGGDVSCDQAVGSIPGDFEDHQVTGTAENLDPERIYRFRLVASNANGTSNGSDALVPGLPLVETTGSPVRTATTARLDSRVNPHGTSTAYHFDYVTDSEFQTTGFANAQSTPDTTIDSNEVQTIQVRGVSGQFKLSFEGESTVDLPFNASAGQVQAALRALPSIGSPNAVVNVTGSTFQPDVFGKSFFNGKDYRVIFTGALTNIDVPPIKGSDGTIPLEPGCSVCSHFIGTSTSFQGGSRDGAALVSTHIKNLEPDTGYRYRVVAESTESGGPVSGDDAVVVTRASDASLDHGDFPGPPGSDRAWEMVSAPNTGSNPVNDFKALSTDGNRVVYGIAGGSPDSEVGSAFNLLFAERTPDGWQSKLIYPTRSQAKGNQWFGPQGRDDLSDLITINDNPFGVAGITDFWRLSPGAPAQHIYGLPHSEWLGFTYASDDGSRIVSLLEGSLDPGHPATPPPGAGNLYDVSDGTPELIGLLPDGSVPACGMVEGGMMPLVFETRRSPHWVSADGDLAFFRTRGNNCTGPIQLYLRDIEAEDTTLISSSPISGPTCDAGFIRATVDAAFLLTSSRLVAEDTTPSGCGVSRDIYRYDLGDNSLSCLTCIAPGLDANIDGDPANTTLHEQIAVSNDGSRVYFVSSRRLLPEASSGPNIYRVDVASDELAHVAATGSFARSGDSAGLGNAITPDGSVFVFRASDSLLNAIDGADNGGMAQYYLYDDSDRSLVCVSCPSNGTLPQGSVPQAITKAQVGPNVTPITANGDFVFSTPTALVDADQNTAGRSEDAIAGSDIYEWRDGHLLLVTDGFTGSEGSQVSNLAPRVAGVSPSGRDILFLAPAQYTPDAIDANVRLYTARIGGGIEFPPPPPPCPLEVCQGTPKGAPDEAAPGTSAFAGSGNPREQRPRVRCGKGKRRVHRAGKTRCVKRTPNRANRNRRTAR